MKIQYCSDLHIEFHDNMRFMKSLPLEVVGDVLVIAGDVGYLVDTTIPHQPYGRGSRPLTNSSFRTV